MKIELVNWSGHNNLGDDAMAKILKEYFPNARNVGEKPSGTADWYIMGGGTLLSPSSLFIGLTPPEKTILISIGCGQTWDGHGADWLKKIHTIYARDTYTYGKLLSYNIKCKESIDLLCYLKGKKRKRSGVWANIMVSNASMVPEARGMALHEASMTRDKFFAMSPDEDLRTIPDADLYTDAQQLINDLSGVEMVIATRLHAVVCAWVAGCKIRPIPYDIKVIKFLERVEKETPNTARRLISKHLKEIKSVICR